ncbi:MAG: hypothetical protein V1810_01210 [Candidatus Beckwithbacteria bacterium]
MIRHTSEEVLSMLMLTATATMMLTAMAMLTAPVLMIATASLNNHQSGLLVHQCLASDSKHHYYQADQSARTHWFPMTNFRS